MRISIAWLICLALALGALACSSSDDGQDASTEEDAATEQDLDNGTDDDTKVDAGSDVDAGTETDAGPDAGPETDEDISQDQDQPVEQSIGAPCHCEGDDCEQMGVPLPTADTIVGCDNVPSVASTALVCLRSYNGSLATHTFFANGFCALMSTRCEGANLICGSAVFGDYDAHVVCPAGTVMISLSEEIEVFGQKATIDNKSCHPGCADDNDCRTGETDPVFSAPAQYQCVDKNGVKFCHDPQNLTVEYTAVAF